MDEWEEIVNEFDKLFKEIEKKNAQKKFLNENEALELFHEDYQDFEYINEEFKKDKDFCSKACKINGLILRYIPEKFKDYEFCLDVVKNCGIALREVPKNLIDKVMCLEAVKNYGLALEFVPNDLKDYDVCIAACKEYDLSNLLYIPHKFFEDKKFMSNVFEMLDSPLSFPYLLNKIFDEYRERYYLKDEDELNVFLKKSYDAFFNYLEDTTFVLEYDTKFLKQLDYNELFSFFLSCHCELEPLDNSKKMEK